MTDRSKIRGQRIAGTSVQQQREIANAVKNAREMALLPYTKRVASARAGRPGSDRDRDRDRDEDKYVDKYATDAADAVDTGADVDTAIETETEA
jgi:small subunit ribosomal protein S18